MILSVSRRTDIPAFYLDWFVNRIKEGYVLVRNPLNYRQVSRISLSRDLVDFIVFWTKDPTRLVNKLDYIERYPNYVQVTINPYSTNIERNVPPKSQIIESFQKLSRLIGKERVIWRYDPIILTDKMDVNYHIEYFGKIASTLSGYTERCIISFLDMYIKTERNMKSINTQPISNDLMLTIAESISQISRENGIKVASCSEVIDLSSIGIEHAKCIDDKLISKILGQSIQVSKDSNQRESCGCVQSIDIGAYNTCSHGCLYCYANYSDNMMKKSIGKHDVNSPMLVGNLEVDDTCTERKMVSYLDSQMRLDISG